MGNKEQSGTCLFTSESENRGERACILLHPPNNSHATIYSINNT